MVSSEPDGVKSTLLTSQLNTFDRFDGLNGSIGSVGFNCWGIGDASTFGVLGTPLVLCVSL